MQSREELTDQKRRKAIRRYVSKNTAIPAFFETIAEYQFELEQLKSAVAQGNHEHPIFEHQHCQLFCLYLIEQGELPFEEGMTVYHYLLTLAQFTDKQSLRDEDADVKSLREVFVRPLYDSSSQKLTPEGKQYFEHVEHLFLQKYSIVVDKKKFIERLKLLSPFERLLIHIWRGDESSNWIDLMLGAVRDNLPYLANMVKSDVVKAYKAGNDQALLKAPQYYALPSMSVCQHFLHAACPNPIQALPVFGSISIKTLTNLHAKDQHPIAWYANAVRSFPKKVHDRRCGPVPTMLHDLAHQFWGSLLLPEQRSLIFSDFIPLFEQVRGVLAKPMFTTVIAELVDYDLARLPQVINPNRRFTSYLIRVLQFARNKVIRSVKGKEYEAILAPLQQMCSRLTAERSPLLPFIQELESAVVEEFPSLLQRHSLFLQAESEQQEKVSTTFSNRVSQ